MSKSAYTSAKCAMPCHAWTVDWCSYSLCLYGTGANHYKLMDNIASTV